MTFDYATVGDEQVQGITNADGSISFVNISSAIRIFFKKSSGNSRFFKCRDESVPFVYAININCESCKKLPKMKVFTCSKNICSV